MSLLPLFIHFLLNFLSIRLKKKSSTQNFMTVGFSLLKFCGDVLCATNVGNHGAERNYIEVK